MAQHRTKQDKQNAQVHRLEKAKTYSLSDIGFASNTQVGKKAEILARSENFGVEMSHVKTDLFRTLISALIVVGLLASGVYFLQ